MPQVGKKKFPYTKEGKKSAAFWKKKIGAASGAVAKAREEAARRARDELWCQANPNAKECGAKKTRPRTGGHEPRQAAGPQRKKIRAGHEPTPIYYGPRRKGGKGKTWDDPIEFEG